ncbi:MAG: TlpA disulfide reductase family protein [Streptosporangiaceae bacterium]
MFRLPRFPRRAAHPARARLACFLRQPDGAAVAALSAVIGLAIAGCSGGAIGQDTAASNGTSFVAGSYATTVYASGSRPVAPDITGTTLGGRRLSLSSYRGDVVVLNFWGSWCGPCRAEAPALEALARRFRSSGVRFIGVDIQDSPVAAKAFQHTFLISYPSLNDPSDEIALAFRSTVPPAGIPTTLVMDRTGRIAARIVGEATYSTLGRLIASVAAGAS